MSDDTQPITAIRTLLRPLLARRLTAIERRALVDALRQLAEEQERLAEADEHVGHVVRRAAIEQQAVRQKTGRPKGSGAHFLRWESPRGEGKTDRRSGHLHIGRALDQELDEPKRMDVQRLGSTLELRPCGEGEGWAVNRSPNGMPRLSIGQEAADTLRLVEGRWPATIRGGAIVATMP